MYNVCCDECGVELHDGATFSYDALMKRLREDGWEISRPWDVTGAWKGGRVLCIHCAVEEL